MRYADLRTWTLDRLVGGVYEGVHIMPGPDDRQAPPGRFVMFTGIGGPGLNTEYLFDGRSVQALAVGEQNDYQDAEDLAFAIDHIFISAYSQSVAGKWMTSVTRQGGPPTPLPTVDDADRYRFTCNYTFDVQSSVA